MPWADLNKRQQTYLQAVYEVDQTQEANVRWLGSQGRWVSTPASEWRWMPYNASGSALLRKIKDAGYVDQGTGSTSEALERRGLVLCRIEVPVYASTCSCCLCSLLGHTIIRIYTPPFELLLKDNSTDAASVALPARFCYAVAA